MPDPGQRLTRHILVRVQVRTGHRARSVSKSRDDIASAEVTSPESHVAFPVFHLCRAPDKVAVEVCRRRACGGFTDQHVIMFSLVVASEALNRWLVPGSVGEMWAGRMTSFAVCMTSRSSTGLASPICCLMAGVDSVIRARSIIAGNVCYELANPACQQGPLVCTIAKRAYECC